MTLLGWQIIEVSGAQLYSTSFVHCIVCSPCQVKSVSITIYPPFTLLHRPPSLLPPSNHHSIVHIHAFLLSFFPFFSISPPLTKLPQPPDRVPGSRKLPLRQKSERNQFSYFNHLFYLHPSLNPHTHLENYVALLWKEATDCISLLLIKLEIGPWFSLKVRKLYSVKQADEGEYTHDFSRRKICIRVKWDESGKMMPQKEQVWEFAASFAN